MSRARPKPRLASALPALPVPILTFRIVTLPRHILSLQLLSWRAH